jgi:hypothetical protein
MEMNLKNVSCKVIIMVTEAMPYTPMMVYNFESSAMYSPEDAKESKRQ